jgi:hypothetical protein
MKKPAALFLVALATALASLLTLTGCPEKQPATEGPAATKPATSAPANATATPPANPPKSGGGW